jgi:hypothetical protein
MVAAQRLPGYRVWLSYLTRRSEKMCFTDEREVLEVEGYAK